MTGSERLYTTKVFYQILGKRLKTRRRQFRALCRLDFLKKKRNFSKNVNAGDLLQKYYLRIYDSKTPSWKFSEKCSDYFRDFYLFSEPNNYGLIGLCQGNCLSVI